MSAAPTLAPVAAPAGPLARLDELENFCATHQRRPVPAAVDAAERELAEWVLLTRRRRAHRAAVDAVQGPWPVRHPRRVQELRMFVLVHGHRPDPGSADAAERSLASWVLEATYRPDGDPEVALLLAVTPTAAAAARAEMPPVADPKQ